MNKKWLRIIFAIGIFLFVLGVIALFQATNFGAVMAQKAMTDNGGCMDTQEYYWIMQSKALSLQLCGTLISALGGLSAVLTLYKSNGVL